MQDTTIKFHQLPNGLRLVHKQNNSAVAHLGIMINVGSRDENTDEEGIAHFIEHTIFKGTKKRKAYHILSRLENVGGEIDAYTTKEETCVYASFMNGFYDRTFELLSDIVFNSIYPEKELEKEKEVVYDEINSYKDSPAESIYDDFEEFVFEGHELAHPILGEKEKIKKFSKEKIEKFISTNYHTDQIVLSSVGNIDFKKIIKYFEKYFGEIKENLRTNKRIKFNTYKAKSLNIKKQNHQAHCIIGNVAYSINNPKRTSLVLLNNILAGQGMNSRLNLSLREKYGYAYNIESNYTPYSDSGLLSIYFGTDKEYHEKSISIVLKELKKLQNKELGLMQLSVAKRQLIGQLAISSESQVGTMLNIAKSYLMFNKVDSLEKTYTKINSINSANLIDTANEVFCIDKLSFLSYI